MEYKSAAQMAAQWGISDRRVRILCQEGKIEGVLRDGRTWRIPADAEKPVDGRTTRYHRNDSAYAAWFAEVDALKQELDRRRPLTQGELKRLRDEFLVEYTYHSNAIEGNTLTLQETALVLAGVSAGTTIDILSAAPWVKTPGMRLVCLPATKAPVLRRWLWEQGFDIEQERLALAAGRWYTAIGAAYTGQRRQPTWEECLLGRWQGLPGAAGYAAQLAKKLEKVLRGLEPGGEEWKEAAALAERLRRPQGAEHGEN